MNPQEVENHGTSLSDVFHILVEAPRQRLQSLTVQLGASPEDQIIHALCLVVLQRTEQALNKVQTLGDNQLANHLAERLQEGGVELEDFGNHCARLDLSTGETFKLLARIFKVLSEQRLCDPGLRDLAYRRALSSTGQKTSSCEDLKFHRFLEEAKNVCGPEVAEDEISDKLKVSLGQDQPEQAPSLPSPLQATSFAPSYPSHIEVSLPPTVPYPGDGGLPEVSDESKPNTINLKDECNAKNSQAPPQSLKEPQPKSNQAPPLKSNEASLVDVASATQSMKLDKHSVPKPDTGVKVSLPPATTSAPPIAPEEDDGLMFYAFVILHAPEDEDMAARIKDRMEEAVGRRGAIFSEHFAIAGRSTLRCVEDAINNSGFTVLLLTRNFNTHMEELETNSALINAINKEHKYNTVIPLLPKENPMPKQDIPLVLSTLILLIENNMFESKVKKAMGPKIKELHKIWENEQMVKRQREKQDVLKKLNQAQRQLIQELEKVEILERESRRLRSRRLDLSEEPGGEGQARLQPPSIHIQNAQYIIIGNDSQMTVDHGGAAETDQIDE